MKDEVLEVLLEVRPDIDFEVEDNLIEDGLITSFEVIKIITLLMEKFNINIDAADMDPDNLNSLDAIVNMVSAKANN